MCCVVLCYICQNILFQYYILQGEPGRIGKEGFEGETGERVGKPLISPFCM